MEESFMAMIKCKECGAEISSSAKRCPNCGKDSRNFFMKHKIISVILILIVLSVAGAAIGGGNNGKNPSDDKSAATVLPKVGDVLTTSDYQIVIKSVKTSDKVGNQYFNKKPASGGIFVVLNYTIKNVTDKPIGAFSTPIFQMQDSKGTNYDADIDASAYYATEAELNDKVLSDLNPGITVKGADVFEISKNLYNAGGWKVYINADDDLYVKAN
jgi:DNA-directed RNA polymerase subunit RPC12/RpoP